MEYGLIATVVSAVLALASVVLGVKYRQGLEKARLFAELLNEIIVAAEDDKVSEEELRQIVAKVKQVASDVEE